MGESVGNKERSLCAEGTFRRHICTELVQQQNKLMFSEWIGVSKETSNALNYAVLYLANSNQSTIPLPSGIGIFFGGSVARLENWWQFMKLRYPSI